MEASSVKIVYSKRNHTNGDVSTTSHNQEFSEGRNTSGEGPMDGEVSPCNEAFNIKNRKESQGTPHPRPNSGKKKLKENGSEPKSRRGRGKSAADATDVGGRVQKRKQQNGKENHGSNLRHQEEVASEHNHKETRLDQPMKKRRQKQTSKAASERGKDQCPRVTKSRNTELETLPPTTQPNGKGTKRSRRVAQRLAPEEPPPPPLKLPKLNLVLSRKEIQEDWLQMTGHKYTGKPKKSTLIQKDDGLFRGAVISRKFDEVPSLALEFVIYICFRAHGILTMDSTDLPRFAESMNTID